MGEVTKSALHAAFGHVLHADGDGPVHVRRDRQRQHGRVLEGVVGELAAGAAQRRRRCCRPAVRLCGFSTIPATARGGTMGKRPSSAFEIASRTRLSNPSNMGTSIAIAASPGRASRSGCRASTRSPHVRRRRCAVVFCMRRDTAYVGYTHFRDVAIALYDAINADRARVARRRIASAHPAGRNCDRWDGCAKQASRSFHRAARIGRT